MCTTEIQAMFQAPTSSLSLGHVSVSLASSLLDHARMVACFTGIACVILLHHVRERACVRVHASLLAHVKVLSCVLGC